MDLRDEHPRLAKLTRVTEVLEQFVESLQANKTGSRKMLAKFQPVLIIRAFVLEIHKIVLNFMCYSSLIR